MSTSKGCAQTVPGTEPKAPMAPTPGPQCACSSGTNQDFPWFPMDFWASKIHPKYLKIRDLPWWNQQMFWVGSDTIMHRRSVFLSFISVIYDHLPFIYHSTTTHHHPIMIHLFSFIIGLTRIWPRFIRMSSSCQVDKKKSPETHPAAAVPPSMPPPAAVPPAVPAPLVRWMSHTPWRCDGVDWKIELKRDIDITDSPKPACIGLCPEFPFRTDIDMNIDIIRYWIFDIIM